MVLESILLPPLLSKTAWNLKWGDNNDFDAGGSPLYTLSTLAITLPSLQFKLPNQLFPLPWH